MSEVIMVEPIEEDNLKRSRINKQYQDYSDQMDAADSETAPGPSGTIEGRKVTNISSEDSIPRDLFKRSH